MWGTERDGMLGQKWRAWSEIGGPGQIWRVLARNWVARRQKVGAVRNGGAHREMLEHGGGTARERMRRGKRPMFFA